MCIRDSVGTLDYLAPEVPLRHHSLCARSVLILSCAVAVFWRASAPPDSSRGRAQVLRCPRKVTLPKPDSNRGRVQVLRCPRKVTADENKGRPDLVYGAAADVWALGVLLFEVVVGHAPFQTVRPPFVP